MVQKLKLIAKQIPWSLACRVGLVCMAVWWQSSILFAGAMLVSTFWPIAGSIEMIPTMIGLIAIALAMPSVGVLWTLLLLLAILFLAIKDVMTGNKVSLHFLEYAIVATGLVVFFAQATPFFSVWTVLSAMAIAIWLFIVLQGETKNYIRAGISAFVWWQILLGILFLPVSVGVQAFLAYMAFACIAEYQKD